MAKSSSGNGRRSNKSDAIREALAQNPGAKTKEIVAALAAKGMKVAPTLIYYVKSKQNRARRRARRARAYDTARHTATSDPVGVVLRVRDLAREVGGMRSLKQLVDVLAES